MKAFQVTAKKSLETLEVYYRGKVPSSKSVKQKVRAPPKQLVPGSRLLADTFEHSGHSIG